MKNVNQSYFMAILWSALVLSTTIGCGQEDKSKRPSPPDQVSSTVDNTTITIDYSRPSMKGRKIFGELEPYGKVWRTGANEATTFEVSNDVTIEGQPLPAGKYALFTIPEEDEWTLIFNKEPNQWGAYEYQESQDALRVKVQPKKAPETTEMLTFNIDENGTVTMLWEDTQVDFKVASAGNSNQ